nr:hypothetical protein [uncultured Duganella sp.]
MPTSPDRREDVLRARTVEHALGIVQSDGVGPALEYMAASGIGRHIALRVLTDPAFQRGRNERSTNSQ